MIEAGGLRIRFAIALFTITCCILAALLGIGFRARAQNASSHVLDGSRHPELIPDETMYALIFLTATAPSKDATSTEKGRAKAHIANLPLSSQDQATFAEHALAYRNGYEALRSGPPTKDEAEFQQRKLDLVRNAAAALDSRLSGLGRAQIKQLLQNEKRAVKLVPIPVMNGSQAQTWGERILARIVDLIPTRTVFAQSMGDTPRFIQAWILISMRIFTRLAQRMAVPVATAISVALM